MNTKKYAPAFIAIVAVLLVFSSPVVADYSGDHPLTIYDHDTINGGLVYETVTDGSKYKCLYPQQGDSRHPFVFLYQDLTITLPEGATVKTARLYNYYTWSGWQDSDTIGVPAQATLTVTDTTSGVTWTRTCSHSYIPATRDDCPNPIGFGDVVHYWDTKGQDYSSKTWDFPSGTFAWDVTDLVTHSGTYTASIRDSRAQGRVGDERFCTFGFGLLVVYEKPGSSGIEYGIAEGCDLLMARAFETPADATTSATFGGISGATDANLITVLDCSDGGSGTPPENMIYFNSNEIGPSTAGGIEHIGLNYFDVTTVSGENVVEFQDRNDYEGVHNAFLVVESGKCGDVDGNGISNILDGKKVAKGEISTCNWAADVDCNGITNILDGKKIAKGDLNCC